MKTTVFIFFFLVLSLYAKAQTSKSIVVQNHYYPKAGKDREVYEWRLHASEVRSKLGLPKGRVLRKLNGNTGPYVIWECEYESVQAREKDIALIDQSEEFKKIQEHMGTLIDKFERSIYEIDN
jgi:hypothetical protein